MTAHFAELKMELSKAKFNLFASLGSAKMRRKHSLFTVEGEKSVADTAGHFSLVALIRVKGHEIGFAHDASKVFDVTPDEMRRLSNLSTASPLMAVYSLPAASEAQALKVPYDLYVVLDGVQDPGNLGTIIRTCHWFGIYKIFASRDTVDVFNPKTIQATMGSLAHVEVIYCDLLSLLEANPALPVYGTLLEGDDLFTTEVKREGFIVMGNEGKGITAPIRSRVTKPLFIPPADPSNHSESLNVAIATAIVVSRIVNAHR